MESFDEYIGGRSLDALLREARQEDIKKETALVKADKNEAGREYNNGLSLVIGKEFSSQQFKNFSEVIKKISSLEDLFYGGRDISLVLKNLIELQESLECIELPKKLKSFMYNIKYKFIEVGADNYLKGLEHPSEDDLRIGNKVRTVFVPFSETKLYRATKYYQTSRGRDFDIGENSSNNAYFIQRNRNFPPGSVGKIIGFDTGLAVQFDKEGNWSRDWLPDCNYWKERKNTAEYEAKELEVLPNIGSVEVTAFNYLVREIGNEISSAFRYSEWK